MTVQVRIHRQPSGDYRYRCGRTVNGLYWLAVGCQHLTPREADRHAYNLGDAADGSLPLGASVEPSPAALVPSLGAARVEGSTESRERLPGSRTAG